MGKGGKSELEALFGDERVLIVSEFGSTSNHVRSQIPRSYEAFRNTLLLKGYKPKIYKCICYWIGKTNINDGDIDVGIWFKEIPSDIFDSLDNHLIFQEKKNDRYVSLFLNKLKKKGHEVNSDDVYRMITKEYDNETLSTVRGRYAEYIIHKILERHLFDLGVLDEIKIETSAILRNDKNLHYMDDVRLRQIDGVFSFSPDNHLAFLQELMNNKSLDVTINESSALYEALRK